LSKNVTQQIQRKSSTAAAAVTNCALGGSNEMVDVATTPELVRFVSNLLMDVHTRTCNQLALISQPTSPQEIDLEQAHELSKHIVTEIINQAVDILNKENSAHLSLLHHHHQHQNAKSNSMKRKPSF